MTGPGFTSVNHRTERFTAARAGGNIGGERSVMMMRLLLLSLTAVAFGPAVAQPQPATQAAPTLVTRSNPAERIVPLTEAGTMPAIDPDTGQAVRCRENDAHVAGRVGPAPIEPLRPQKLTKLPPATGYMAVYRHIGGCNAPLTMVEYRNPRRR